MDKLLNIEKKSKNHKRFFLKKTTFAEGEGLDSWIVIKRAPTKGANKLFPKAIIPKKLLAEGCKE
ncbi:MAG: hypothetical protein SVO01_01630 [Thermotogota bacterium]|nr:hypothetical protein [Thermotogota bacterium]